MLGANPFVLSSILILVVANLVRSVPVFHYVNNGLLTCDSLEEMGVAIPTLLNHL